MAKRKNGRVPYLKVYDAKLLKLYDAGETGSYGAVVTSIYFYLLLQINERELKRLPLPEASLDKLIDELALALSLKSEVISKGLSILQSINYIQIKPTLIVIPDLEEIAKAETKNARNAHRWYVKHRAAAKTAQNASGTEKAPTQPAPVDTPLLQQSIRAPQQAQSQQQQTLTPSDSTFAKSPDVPHRPSVPVKGSGTSSPSPRNPMPLGQYNGARVQGAQSNQNGLRRTSAQLQRNMEAESAVNRRKPNQ